MAPVSNNVKKIGIAAAVVTGVSIGSYMTVDNLSNANSNQVSQEIERNISEVKSKNKEANLNDKEEENIDFKIESENEKFDEIVERAIQNEEVDYSKLFAYEDKEDVKEYALNNEIVERAVQNEKVDYSDLFAYEDKEEDVKEFVFNDTEAIKPKINSDGQFAFNDEQMNQNEDGNLEDDYSVAIIDLLTDKSEEPVEPQPEPDQPEVPVDPWPIIPVDVRPEEPDDPQPEPEQPKEPVDPQPEPEQPEEPVDPKPEPEQPEVPVDPKPEPEQPEDAS